MILKITRQTVNNSNIIKTFDPIVVNVNQIELDLYIIPKLKKMIAINNLYYNLIGSDNKCQYFIERVNMYNAAEFEKKYSNYVDNGIKHYNDYVNAINVDIKRSNKKNNRPIATGLLSPITEDTVRIGAIGVSVNVKACDLVVK